MFRRRRAGLGIVACLCMASALNPEAAFALDPDRLPSQFLHDEFSRAEGLPSEVVWDLAEDRSGYLWLGTQNGLARFDGQRFTVFGNQTDPAFVSNDIRSVRTAPDGSLWLGSYGGGALRMYEGGFTRFDTDDGIAHNVIYDIYIDRTEAVWFATAGGVTRLRDGEFESWTSDDGLVGDRVFRIAESADGALWFATLTHGLSRFDGEVFENYTSESALDSAQVHLLFEDPENGLTAGTYTGGLFEITPDGPAPLERDGLPSDLPMQAGLRDRDGSLWIGSYGRGLWRLSRDGPASPFAPGGFDQPHIFDLHEDRQGNLWVATMNGVHRFRAGPFFPWGGPEGVSDATFVMAETPGGGPIWVGTEGNGVFELDASGPVSNLTVAEGLPSNAVSALMVQDDGTLWVGTFGGGAAVVAGEQVTRIDMDDGLASNHVFAIIERADGSIWMAADGGVSEFRDGRIVETLSRDDGLPDNLVRHMMEDSQGRLWLSTSGGLAMLNDGEVTSFSTRQGLAADLVSTTHEDGQGTLWIGSRNSGLAARLKDGRIFQFRTGHGLPQQSVLAIVEDRGQLWLSGSGGLVRASLEDLNAVADGRADAVAAQLFDETDGLRSAQFVGGFQPAGLRAADGRLWFPTNRGLVSIDPSDIEPASEDLQIIIEQVRVDGAPIDIRRPIELSSRARSLEVDYTAPRMAASESLQFRYRLDGTDDDWQFAANRRTAYFTSLGPGRQTFRVEVTTEGRSFDDSVIAAAGLEIHRSPHWYQTWWFTLLASAAILALPWLIHRIALRRTHLRQQHLEQLVAKRTAELQSALTKVERISRIDGLTGVANRRYFEELLDRDWQRAIRDGSPISVAMIDIDRFKQYNDAVGHQAGDECLRRVAAALQSGLTRATDLVARYGGEEFVMLLPGADPEASGMIAERIRTRILALGIEHPDSDVSAQVSVSIGCATAHPMPGDAAENLVQSADEALYCAKRAGRNRVERAPA